jgi:hypothetical protein
MTILNVLIMNEELHEKLKRWMGFEEPDASRMECIGNKFPLETNESGVPEFSKREAAHGYQ